jgi:L-lactate dehydrogenase complex protein LldF
MRLLGRTASGIETTSYNTFATGPRGNGDTDGPAAFHVVLLDNGRTDMLGGEFQDMLRCIRCGACLNHCPVYKAVGGHAYGWVYSGPMGAVLTPTFVGVDEAGHLPNASTFCGRCAAVCPMGIPLPKMMRHWREREFEARHGPASYRRGLGLWAWFAKRPALYRLAASLGAGALGRVGRRRGRMSYLPFARGWTMSRDMPAPEGATFHDAWRKWRSSR